MWEKKGEKIETERERELSWQRSKNGKATVNYHLHPQVWCIHNGEGDRTPATKSQLVITCRYFWSTVCRETSPVLFLFFILQKWESVREIPRGVLLDLSEIQLDIRPLQSLVGDHLRAAGCTIITFFVASVSQMENFVFPYEPLQLTITVRRKHC